MRFIERRPFGDPDAAARKLIALAKAFEPVQDGRIYIEKINGPFLFELKGTPAEYKAGLSAPSLPAGSCCTRAGRTCSSPSRARRCSIEKAVRYSRTASGLKIEAVMKWYELHYSAPNSVMLALESGACGAPKFRERG